ncbi:MAG: FlgD immunoglobulin-like domain containing protein, partial [Anaerolineales bacterium]|nr:FlgD immunoglobulin-like domain containing protein [Anaerolineales bacterium]
AINDAPKWKDGFPPDTTMMENDTFRIVFKEFVDDVDDTKLAFKLKATSFENYTIYDSVTGKALSTQPGIMGIDSSVYVSYAPGDGDSIARFIPTKLWSGYAEIEAIVTDSIDNPQNPKSDTTIFIIDVIRIPRPYLTFDIIQNNVFTSFYDILITDTISKATNIGLYYGPPYINRITLDQVGPFTYRHHKKIIDDKEGETISFQVVANAVVGDTVKNGSFEIQLARSLSRWKGFSTDGLFSVTGEPGAVSRDQYILIMDSTMFEKGYRGSYKLGYEAQSFSNPVEISLASYDDEQALYQRNSDNSWTELPSYSQHGRIKAFTDKMGYFRLGRKTVIVPGLTSLGQNYPNPFNPVTNITYDVGFVDGPQQQVNLSIYNILGQHVQTLFRGQQGPGQYSTMWYGRDKSGVSVASGIYFVHMTTSAGEVQTNKVMLLR